MARRYEEAKPARFRLETVDGVEQIRIGAQRNWFALPFLALWLTAWSFGGVGAVSMLITHFQPVLLLWLVAWAMGWVFVAATVAWQLGGAEILRVEQGDLAIAYRLPPFTRRRLYRGSEIRDLAASGAGDFFGRMNGIYAPFFAALNKTGSVRFSYGARTIHAAAGLHEPEGRMIVEHLRRRLPIAAVAAARRGPDAP